MTWLAHGLRLARIDVVRTIRKQSGASGGSSIFGLIVFVLLVAVGSLGGGYLGYRIGGLLAAGSLGDLGPFAPVEIVRGILALFWLVLTLVIAVRALGQRGTLAEPEGILTAVPTGQALLGVLLAEYAYLLAWVALPAIAIGLGLAIGTGVVWPVIAVPVGVAAAGAGSVGLGYPLGLSVRHVATRFEFVARNKGVLVVVIFLAYFVALSTGAWNELMVQLFEPMQASPVGWYADLVLFGTVGVGASTVFAGAALALTVGLVAVAVIGGTRVAAIHWFSDPALAGAEEAVEEGAADPGLERRLEPVLGTATASLVVLSWRRAIRSPLKLLYAFYPLIFLAGLLADIVQSGRIPAYLPFLILVCAAWAAGVIFTLNPLGDQGAVVASTLLSGVDGREFVRAHLLAGLVVAIPIGTAVTAAVGVLSPIDSQTLVVLIVGTPVVMLVAAGLSVGIGMAFPRFEETHVTRSMKTVIPSRWAFVLFTLHLFATAGAAALLYEPTVRELAAVLITWILPFGLGVTPGVLFAASAIALVPLLVAPIVSYRYAVRRFEGFTVA